MNMARRPAMLAVRLTDDIERRLDRLAERTGRTRTFYARAAIEAHLDDLEDFYLAEDRMRDFRAGDAVPLSALKAALGLDDRVPARRPTTAMHRNNRRRPSRWSRPASCNNDRCRHRVRM
jgi:RHH-type rel operon transcriptional repressor/antitoxin RelB